MIFNGHNRFYKRKSVENAVTKKLFHNLNKVYMKM